MFKETEKKSVEHEPSVGNLGIYPVLTATALLSDHRRKEWVQSLVEWTQVKPVSYQLYYAPVLANFAEFVQNLPETQRGFYSHAGGFLDHGLERTVRVMQLSGHYLASNEVLPSSDEEKALWHYAVYTASLLFDVGKLVAKSMVMLRQQAKKIKLWNPFEGSMLKFATHYSYDFDAENWDELRRHVTPLIAQQIMPELGFGWLSSDKGVLSAWFALLQENYRQVGAYLSIIPLADAELLEGYFKVYEKELAEKRKLDKLALFKDPGLALKAGQLPPGQGAGLFGGPASIDEKLKEGSSQERISTVAGEAFLDWLKKGLADGKISVNLPNSGVHRVSEGVLLLAGVFQAFAKENPVYGDWRQVKQQFEQLEVGRQVANQQQEFRQYATASDFKLLREVTLVTNVYVAFLHHQKLPPINPHIIAANRASEAFIPQRPALASTLSQSQPLQPNVQK